MLLLFITRLFCSWYFFAKISFIGLLIFWIWSHKDLIWASFNKFRSILIIDELYIDLWYCNIRHLRILLDLSDKDFILLFLYDLVFEPALKLSINLVVYLVLDVVPDSSKRTCFSKWLLYFSVYYWSFKYIYIYISLRYLLFCLPCLMPK